MRALRPAGRSARPLHRRPPHQRAAPPPCDLLTATDVAPFFDNAETSATSGPGTVPGVASCGYNLKVGTQGRQVGLRTLDDFEKNNPNYGYAPPTSMVPGLGDSAVLATPGRSTRVLTVRPGSAR